MCFAGIGSVLRSFPGLMPEKQKLQKTGAARDALPPSVFSMGLSSKPLYWPVFPAGAPPCLARVSKPAPFVCALEAAPVCAAPEGVGAEVGGDGVALRASSWLHPAVSRTDSAAAANKSVGRRCIQEPF